MLEKKDTSVFSNKQADDVLKAHKIKELYVSGISINFCIKDLILASRTKFGTVVSGALQRGYKVNLVVDGIAGIDYQPGDQYRVLMQLGAAGARPVTTAQAIEEILMDK
nr:isochorismatase family protein [Desulfotignum balticum]